MTLDGLRICHFTIVSAIRNYAGIELRWLPGRRCQRGWHALRSWEKRINLVSISVMASSQHGTEPIVPVDDSINPRYGVISLGVAIQKARTWDEDIAFNFCTTLVKDLFQTRIALLLANSDLFKFFKGKMEDQNAQVKILELNNLVKSLQEKLALIEAGNQVIRKQISASSLKQNCGGNSTSQLSAHDHMEGIEALIDCVVHRVGIVP
ncbi:hypothetical protein FCM35_KLT20724 [Carex littledalei]|uniref:Uncharacterized protein n=1 Tax=Carex littledalei TaxID=544730 RepID=A0A833QW65_9POAL|nr:hypothetical protein FCM35_KLT20724 [Carex littledalei]